MHSISYTLKEIAEIQTGPFGSQLHNKDYVPIGTPIVTVEHLGSRKFTLQNLPCVSELDCERLSKYSLNEGDIVFSRVGSVDRCSYVSKEEDGWLFSGRCLRVRPNEKIDGLFLYYYLTQENVRNHLRSIAVGATMPSLNTKILSGIEISIPDISEQKRIAAILGSLDDKIELNRKMNENLEQQAAALFKHWFIDFEFPDAKGKPYRSNGGKMKDSPLGLIPDEWEVGRLKDLVQINVASLANKDNYNFINYLDTGSITDNHISSYQKLLKGVDKFPSRAKRKVRKNNIVYSLVRPNQRHFGIITEPEDNMIASTGFAVIEAKCHCAHFIYFYLIREECIKHLQAIAEQSVSTYPTLRPSDIENLLIVLPPLDLLSHFETIASSFIYKVYKNNQECQSLISNRDAILNKLMNLS